MSSSVNNFNSIKVRLELCSCSIKMFIWQFQFHKGTIRTLVADYTMLIKLIFQFHKGTIRTTAIPLQSKKQVNFNSIKVRLELKFFAWLAKNYHISIP